MYKRILRILLRIFLALFLLFILLVLFVRSPWGQNLIVGKVTEYVSEKIDTRFEIGKLYITFSGNITLEELFLEDKAKDTLVYSRYLEADVPLRPLIFGDEIRVDLVDWRGLKANVHRQDTINGFNFQFIIDAFATGEKPVADTEEDSTTDEDPLQISLGRISFIDFDFKYKDEVTGIDTELLLGNFEVESESIDLDNMKFHLSKVHLKETSIVFFQTQPSVQPEEQEESALPQIIIDQLSFEKVNVNYKSIPGDISTKAYFDNFQFSGLDVDLESQNYALDELIWKQSDLKFEMESFATEAYVNDLRFSGLKVNLESQDVSLSSLVWKESNLKLETNSTPVVNEENEAKINSSEAFTWPQWNIEVKDIDLQNQNIEFYQDGKRPKKDEFSAEAMAFNSLYFKLKNIAISKDEKLAFDLNDFRFREESGFNLKEFKVVTRLNSEETSLRNFRLRLNNSSLFANLKMNYTSLDDLINSPEKSTLSLDVSSLKINVKDAYVFAPDLKQNEQIQNMSEHNFEGQLKVRGDLGDLDIPKFSLDWGNNTSLKFNGSLKNVTEVDKLGFELENLVAISNKKDLSRFLSEEELGVSFPESVVLSGNFQKSGNDYRTKSQLKSSVGDIFLDGFFSSTRFIDYKIGIDIKALQLGELLNNEQFGELSMELNSEGKGNSVNELSAQLSSKIDSIRWNSYTFSGMEIKGSLEDGNGDVAFNYDDDNLQFDFLSKIELDSISPKIDLEFNLDGINTQNLGLTPNEFKAKVQAMVQFEGNADKFNLSAQLNDGLVVYEDRPYYLGDFEFASKIDSTQTEAEISSQFLNGSLKANTDIAGITKAIQNHFRNFTKDTTEYERSKTAVKLDVDLSFIDSPIISDVFIEGIEEMDSLVVKINFDESKNILTSNLKLPYFNYQGNEVQGLGLEVESKGDYATFSFGFDKVLAGPVDIAKTELSGKFEDNELELSLDAFKDDKDFFSSLVTINFEEEDLYRVNVSSEKLILNGGAWSIPSDNEIVFQNDSLGVTNFKLSRNSQIIEFTDKLEFEKNHLGIVFENFRLSTITSYFNPDEKLAGGKMSGDFVVIEPFITNGLISNLKIEDLEVTKVPLGNLTLKAKASTNEDYDLSLSLKDAGIDLDIVGVYHTNESETDVDFNIDLKKFEMQTLEGFATDFIKDSKGFMRGKFEVEGDLDDINYDGFLGFKDVEFNLKMLNTLFKIKDDEIDISKERISFKNFKIEDIQDNTITTDGFITTSDFSNPEFDLQFDAKNFQLLNSTIEDNDLYFGKLVFDASAKLGGNLNFPKLDFDLTLNEKTDLTYILPESQASIEERDGIVVFVNKVNPDNILTQQDDDVLDVILTGVEVKSNIKIHKQAKVKVIFNKRTDDNVSIQGGGDFKFDIFRNGKMNLVGKYELQKGSVELNLYNIVKRKFDIASSSSVTWSGDIFDADLDIRAIYNVQTAASSLMASQTAGENSMIQNRYKQQLPFMVYLDVGGQLMSPDLSFQLDMPEDRQGAINGSVYGRISQINQQDDELNKQVFSLLVLNRFYPESGNDGSQGGPATMARDNINQALSDQLNSFSDKLTGNSGISLNFDVNSYTDFQSGSAQDRTEVDVSAQKKLMDDRLVVEAGSQMNVQGDQRPGESQAVVGNVSVEYLITEDGRWKLRGFRKSEYENVIDGQVFVSGIALIFTREFNKFRVLWDKAYRESLEEKEPEVETEAQDTSQARDESGQKQNIELD